MGVANHRSIAWACVESMRKKNYNIIITCQNERTQKTVEKMAETIRQQQEPSSNHLPQILAVLPCNVEQDLPLLLEQQIPEILDKNKTCGPASLDAIVHSIAYASYDTDNDEGSSSSSSSSLNLSNATWEQFQQAQHISAFSLLETAKYAKPLLSSQNSSITALSYIGAVRAVPNYHLMGPAKASLEACVRGLAAELGPTHQCRVNAVSAGPQRTLSARGIPQFTELYSHVQDKAPLRRNVSQQEVAQTVAFLATEGTGITGQTIYVDAGYSSGVPV